MTRVLWAACLATLAAGPLAAADPRPAWTAEFTDTTTKPVFWVGVNWIAFSPDGTRLLLQTEGPRNVRLAPIPGEDRLAFPPVPPSAKGYVRVWDMPTRKERFRLPYSLSAGAEPGSSLGAFLADDVFLLPETGAITARSLADGKPVGSERVSPRPTNLWVPTDRKGFVALTTDPVDRSYLVKVADPGPQPGLFRGPGVRPPPRPAALGPTRTLVAVSPDASRVAVARSDEPKWDPGRLWTITLARLEGTEETELKTVAEVKSPHDGPVRGLAFSPDGKTLATGSEDGALKLWDVTAAGKDWKPRATVTGPDFGAAAIAFRPDGKMLAFGTFDKTKPTLWLVDVAADKVVASVRAGGITALAFSPDGKTLATGGGNGRLQLWDVDALLAK